MRRAVSLGVMGLLMLSGGLYLSPWPWLALVADGSIFLAVALTSETT